MRKITRSLFTFILSFILLSTLTGTVFAAPPAKWTVMVYISGDNNLEPFVVSDIETELAPTGSTKDVQVVTLADRIPGYDTSGGDWTGTLLFHVTKGMTATPNNATEDWGEKDMGDPQTLIDFVTWTKRNYPANHYALIFWGHGWNWRPGVVMRDDTNNDTLDYPEEKAAIPSLGFIDVVGYDGCNMSSIEIFNFWHGHATAVTGSQEWVGAEGLQYDLVLAQLAAHPNMTADQFTVAFAQSATADKTWSAVAVDSRFDTLLAAVADWSAALKKGLAQNRKQYDQAFTVTRSFWQAPADKDLFDMAYELTNKVNDQTIKSKSQAVMNAVSSVVLFDRHVNAYADTHGITIYETSKLSDPDYAYYTKNIDFASQTGWLSFLQAYVK